MRSRHRLLSVERHDEYDHHPAIAAVIRTKTNQAKAGWIEAAYRKTVQRLAPSHYQASRPYGQPVESLLWWLETEALRQAQGSPRALLSGLAIDHRKRLSEALQQGLERLW